MAPIAGSWDFFIVPHTHWDREWYAPFEYFRLQLAGVVDEVIDVLERDPSFASFTLDGQAIVLEDYLEIRPENETRLRALLAAGRIEVGPSYVLPDEFLVGAESLVRNLLIGRAVCRRFGAEPSGVGYLPDSFGHPLQLPQVLAGFGLRSFIFSRGMGDQLDEIGVVFRWRAPDGSEVLAFQQLADYGNFASVRDADDACDGSRELSSDSAPRSNGRGSGRCCSATGPTTCRCSRSSRPSALSSSSGLTDRASGSRTTPSTSRPSETWTCPRGRASCSGADSRTCSAASTPPGYT